MKKVLITGVNGFLGRAIAKHLSNKYEVIGTSLEIENNSGLQIKYIQSDITNRGSLESLPLNIDYIVHCAAIISSDGVSNLLIDANCKGIQNIAAYALNSKCKQFIYFSSLPIIGKPKEIPITEDHPIDPPTVYHATKYFGELVLQLLLKDINLAIFRIPSPIGPNMPENKIVKVFVRNAIKGIDYTLLGEGRRIQNYIDVRDIALAVDCAFEKCANGIFNIASKSSYSNRELADKCNQLFQSSSKINFCGNDEEEDFKWIISTEKAKEKLGFEAIYTLEDTLKLIGELYML